MPGVGAGKRGEGLEGQEALGRTEDDTQQLSSRLAYLACVLLSGSGRVKSREMRKTQNLRIATPVPRYVVGLCLSHGSVLRCGALPG